MGMQAGEAPHTAGVAALNFVDLFMSADMVVKTVMVALMLASLWSWAVIIDKAFKLGNLNKGADAFESKLASGRPLEEIAQGIGNDPKAPFDRLLVSVAAAWRDHKGRNISPAQGEFLVTQLDREMNHIIGSESEHIEDGLSVLAVIATASPFLGLFGTVWGIMNAFSSIASSGNTNLATVAPAISEALFATAMGLGAAIPAYVAFNLFNAKVGKFVGRLENFADELMVSVTRRLGEKIAA
jgi:biopolymer transport protein TolQ